MTDPLRAVVLTADCPTVWATRDQDGPGRLSRGVDLWITMPLRFHDDEIVAWINPDGTPYDQMHLGTYTPEAVKAWRGACPETSAECVRFGGRARE